MTDNKWNLFCASMSGRLSEIQSVLANLNTGKYFHRTFSVMQHDTTVRKNTGLERDSRVLVHRDEDNDTI